jgi:hypothetical protein
MTNVNEVMKIDYSGNLKMDAGIQMNGNPTAVPQPACAAATKGMLWMTKGATDVLEICAQKASVYGWYPLSF